MASKKNLKEKKVVGSSSKKKNAVKAQKWVLIKKY